MIAATYADAAAAETFEVTLVDMRER